MPVHTNPAPDDRIKEWLNSQIDTLQDVLHSMSLPLFAAFDQALVILSYINPFTYLAIIFRFIYRLFVSPHTHRSILGSIILGCILAISLSSSVIAYLTFYRAYVPNIGFSLPVWLQYGETRVPYAILDFSSLAPEISMDQAYNVHLHLTVPTNERNLNMGNFMVQLSLVTAPSHNTTLHHSSRQASLVYEPSFARLLHAFKYLRTLFFFSSPLSAQHIKVPLLEQRIIHPSSLGHRIKIGYAKVEVGRQDVYNFPNLMIERHGWGELQIYRAALVFDAHLDGLRWALYYHPYICFCFFSAFFFTAELTAVFCTWAIILYRTSSPKPHPSSQFPKDESPSDILPGSMLDGSPRHEASALGTTEVDSTSASSSGNRSPGEISGEGENDPPFGNLPIQMEPGDDAVLVGSSRSTQTERSRASGVFGSLTSRRSRKTSKHT